MLSLNHIIIPSFGFISKQSSTLVTTTQYTLTQITKNWLFSLGYFLASSAFWNGYPLHITLHQQNRISPQTPLLLILAPKTTTHTHFCTTKTKIVASQLIFPVYFSLLFCSYQQILYLLRVEQWLGGTRRPLNSLTCLIPVVGSVLNWISCSACTHTHSNSWTTTFPELQILLFTFSIDRKTKRAQIRVVHIALNPFFGEFQRVIREMVMLRSCGYNNGKIQCWVKETKHDGRPEREGEMKQN